MLQSQSRAGEYRTGVFVVLALAALIATPSGAQRSARPTPPCRDRAAAERALRQKEAEWRLSGVPERLIPLLRQNVEMCAYCISTAPSRPTLVFDYKEGQAPKDSRGMVQHIFSWTPVDERIARGERRSGKLNGYYIVVATGLRERVLGVGGVQLAVGGLDVRSFMTASVVGGFWAARATRGAGAAAQTRAANRAKALRLRSRVNSDLRSTR